jgi:hypothetical protein
MPMTPIDGVSRALTLLSRRLGAARGPAAAAGAAQQPSTGQPEKALRDALGLRIQTLDADAPGYAERASEAFVEGVLLHEFGVDLTNDVQFRQLIRSVAREMRADPESAADLDALLRTLRSERPSRTTDPG